MTRSFRKVIETITPAILYYRTLNSKCKKKKQSYQGVYGMTITITQNYSIFVFRAVKTYFFMTLMQICLEIIVIVIYIIRQYLPYVYKRRCPD